MRTVLITGAAGYLGGLLRLGLRARLNEQCRLRLTDRVQLPTPLTPGEEFQRADLLDLQALEALMRDVDAVVHLGVSSSIEEPWEAILSANIGGTYNVFECARRARVKRFVYASSHHVVGFYRRNRCIGTDDPVRPDSRYGVSKVFGESLGRLYADKYGMSVICQRIGVARPRPPHHRALSNWLSERDYVELTRCCLEATDIHFLIVYGVSRSATGFYDSAAAASIGYLPKDNGDDYRAEVAEKQPGTEPQLEALFQGGAYCTTEFDGDPDRIE
jgi:uronate dehydrogenase